MKTLTLLSPFILGLLAIGAVHAQEVNEEMPMMAEPTLMMEENEMPPMDMMMRDGMGMGKMG